MVGEYMSQFDDGMAMSMEGELAEMGEKVYMDGQEVEGVVTDIVQEHAQSKGGRRDISTFTVFLKNDVGEGFLKGCQVEADKHKGRVIKRVDLGGAGWEFMCGPVSSWSGKVPGA